MNANADPGSMTNNDQGRIELRPVVPDDVPFFYQHQLDEEASAMAAFPPRDWQTLEANWSKILAGETNVARTIVIGDDVAGHVCSWTDSDLRFVGYWLDKDFWGKGITTAALSEFLQLDTTRPMYAIAAKDNIASSRVLEKCGFRLLREQEVQEEYDDAPVIELFYELK